MTEFATDYAAADLSPVEEGALRGLASLAYGPSVADLAEFCSGFVAAPVAAEQVRAALLALDALRWAAPIPDHRPTDADQWRITEQGRIALER